MTQPTKWSAPLGSGADIQDLPDDDLRYASFSKIFPQITQVPLPAGGVAPRRIDFNSLFKLLADNIYFYQNGGVFEYSDTADYERGALVRYDDNIYLCIQDNSALNVHNPEEMDYWLRVALSNELSDYLPLAGGNITGNLSVQNKNVVRTVNDVEADVNGNVVIEIGVSKANKDLSNVTAPVQEFKDMSVGWGMPDYNNQIQLNANQVYQANYDCFVTAQANSSNGYFGILTNSINDFPTSVTDYNSSAKRVSAYGGNMLVSQGLLNPTIHAYIPKGNYFKIYSHDSVGSEIFAIYQYPLKGVNINV